MLDQARFLTWPKTRQHKHRLAHSSLTHGDALFRTRDAKPVRTSLLEGLSDLRAAVAVAIALNNAQNFSRRLASFFRRIYRLPNRSEIFRARAKRHFRPDSTPCFLAGTLRCDCHGPSEKFSLRHPAAASAQPLSMPR